MGQELSVLRHYLAPGKCLDFIEDPAGSLVDLLNGLMFIFFYVSFLETSKGAQCLDSLFHHRSPSYSYRMNPCF